MRNRVTAPGDTPPTMVGDTGFIGVNAKLEPFALPPGYVSDAVNMRFRNGVAETRRGLAKFPWINKISAGNVQPWGAVYGVGIFSDPATGIDYIIIAADGGVYYTVDNNQATALALPVGVTITSDVTFTQAFDTIVMFRGADLSPLAMTSIGDGFVTILPTPTTITRLAGVATVTVPQDHGFFSGDQVLISGANEQEYNGLKTVTVTGDTTFTYTVGGTPNSPATGEIRVNTDGTEPIPNAERALFLSNRLIVPHGSDEIAVSDFNSYTKYLPVTSELQVNTGSSDRLVTVEKFNDSTVIAFKSHSVYALSNFVSDLTGIQLDQITDQFGIVAADSVAHCGSDLLFLSQMGVMTIRQTEQNKLQGVTVPLSDPIQPLIDRINWKYAANAKAAYWDNKYYLAVPLDDAELLGNELVTTPTPANLQQADRDYPITVTAGQTYRWLIGSQDYALVNGTQTLTGSGDFVAQGTSVTIRSHVSNAISSSLKRVVPGINNAVLVYDFLNAAWSGYDTATGVDFKRLFLAKHSGIDRLFCVTSEGWILLYEDDYEDVVLEPFTEVVVASNPAVGNTLRVNFGTAVTAANVSNNDPVTWACPSLASAASNIWTDAFSVGGYWSTATTPWTAPNTITQQLSTANGVRFIATNGIQPVVTYTGTWASITETQTQQINSSMTTRAFTNAGGADLARFDWLTYDIQTWNPNYAVTMIMDGVAENRTVSSAITKSRSAYTVFGRAPYDATNVNLDHATDYREDYSILVGAGTGHAATFAIDSSSVDPTRHQEFREEFRVRQRGRSARVNFNCSQGRFRLVSCMLENRTLQTKAGAKT